MSTNTYYYRVLWYSDTLFINTKLYNIWIRPHRLEMKSQIDNLYNNYLRWVVAFRIPYDTLNINRKTSFVRFIPFSYNLTLTLPRIQESASAKPGQIDFGLCANISFYSLISMCTVCCTCFKYIYLYETMLHPSAGTHLHKFYESIWFAMLNAEWM